ncbi:HotDog domain-containing protein [Microdochium trichocladiopsis]|uniref:HotDog domain-containing protein n=1 Tax=Microdochium trichocladiopsis TaxID=1682393 RepID=A0A9P9BP43_9PEZI|nr:HotDog domain-containing protein [Microdochium trichocladiopsis]KAH7028884.1 HotDog domain-containing protein [Microdochium trichocladiopsis]
MGYDNREDIAMAAATGAVAAERQADDIAYFRQIPWCAAILDDPAFTHALTPSRTAKGGVGDIYMAETMATKDTIPRWVTMFTRRQLPADKSEPGMIVQTRTLLQLGDKVAGWPGVAHGGLTSLLLDECCATLLRLRRFVDRDPALLPAGSVTVALNVSLNGKVPAPGVLLVTVTLREVQGRKYFVDGEITANGHSTVLGSATAVFVALKPGVSAKM